MKKIYLIFTILFLVFTSSTSYSQNKNKIISAGLDFAVPLGSLSNESSIGVGTTTKFLWRIGNSSSFIGGNIGIMNFIPRGGFQSNKSTRLASKIPIHSNFRQYFGGFFLEPQFGMSITPSKQINQNFQNSIPYIFGFGWATTVGHTLNETYEFSVGFNAHHNIEGMVSYLSFRVGFKL